MAIFSASGGVQPPAKWRSGFENLELAFRAPLSLSPQGELLNVGKAA